MWDIRKTMENSAGGARKTALGKASGSATTLKAMGSGPVPFQAREDVPIHKAREVDQIWETGSLP